MQDATVTEDIGLDHYTLRIDTSADGIDRSSSASFPALYANETKSTGGESATATQNIHYEVMKQLFSQWFFKELIYHLGKNSYFN